MAKRAVLLAGRYELLDSIGIGGEGHVVRALDHRHERFVALKIRRVRDSHARAAALGEARAMLSLEPHPNIALIRDDFFTGTDHVIVMEHVDGEDLRIKLQRLGAAGLPRRDVLRWLGQVAVALDHMHLGPRPVVHGDVKPANVVARRGRAGRAVLVDLGAASGTSSTRRYAAPELALGVRTPAADVFSLAATAYELLTGSPPEPGAPYLGDAIRRGMSTDPAHRHESASAFVADLTRRKPGVNPPGS